MSEFKRGDIVKSTKSNKVFRIMWFKSPNMISELWPVDKTGAMHNPNSLELYKGALSVLGDI